MGFENLSTENIVYKTKNTRETHRSLILDAVRGRPRGREAKGPRSTSDVWEAKIVPFLNLLINLMENSAFSICQFLYYIFPSYPKVHVCKGLANLKTVLKKKKVISTWHCSGMGTAANILSCVCRLTYLLSLLFFVCFNFLFHQSRCIWQRISTNTEV